MADNPKSLAILADELERYAVEIYSLKGGVFYASRLREIAAALRAPTIAADNNKMNDAAAEVRGRGFIEITKGPKEPPPAPKTPSASANASQPITFSDVVVERLATPSTTIVVNDEMVDAIVGRLHAWLAAHPGEFKSEREREDYKMVEDAAAALKDDLRELDKRANAYNGLSVQLRKAALSTPSPTITENKETYFNE